MPTPRVNRSRRGGIYLMVMIGSATVTSIALVGLSIATERRQAAERAVNAQAATQLAHAAIEIGIHTMATDPSWRWSKGSGWWFKDMALEDGTMALGVTDREGGLLGDGPCRAVVLRGVGMQGTSRTVLEVELEPEVIWPDDGLAVAGALGAIGYWQGELGKDDPQDEIDGHHGDWKGLTAPVTMECLSCSVASSFNGTDSYVLFSHHSDYEISEATIAFWFWQRTTQSNVELFSKLDRASTARGDTTIVLTDTELGFRIRSGIGDAIVRAPAPEVGQWHHVAATFGGKGVALYVDGVLQGTDTPVSNWLTNKNKMSVGRFIDGSVAHMSLFDRALSAGEVATLYDAHRRPTIMRVVPGSWRRATD